MMDFLNDYQQQRQGVENKTVRNLQEMNEEMKKVLGKSSWGHENC